MSKEMKKSKQSSVSLPEDTLIWIDKILVDNKDVLEKLDITTRAKMVKLLANFGKDPLERAIAQLRQQGLGKQCTE
jgi:hypothetical protein